MNIEYSTSFTLEKSLEGKKEILKRDHLYPLWWVSFTWNLSPFKNQTRI